MADPTIGNEQIINNAATKAKADAIQAIDGLSSGDVTAVWPLIENYAIPAASALLILVVGYFVSTFAARICSKPVCAKVDETFGKFVGKLVFYALMVFVILGVLGMFGVSVASFAAVIAAAGFAIGLAFQGTLSNFAAGVLLLVFRPFKIGDVVNVAGITGTVAELDLFTTTINTSDNRRIIIPNSSISNGTIENITFHPSRRVDVNVGTDYSADLKKTREVLENVAKQKAGEGNDYQVYLVSLGDSAINWQVRVWAPTSDYWAVKEKLTEAIKNELDAAGIGIPFPQMELNLTKEVKAGLNIV